MPDILTRKLCRWVQFDDAERAALTRLVAATRPVVRGQHLIREGDAPSQVFLVLEGWAQRYKVLPDGKRQIVAFLMPGDLCDTHAFILEKMDHSISMMSAGKVVAIPADDMLALIDGYPRIAQALWWCTLVDAGILREWLVNIGTREAYSRIAHLFCELYVRAGAVARGGTGDFFMPLTQADVGEALGLTAIHVNRTIKALKQSGLVDPSKSRLRMLDFEGLKAAAAFDAAYLHARLVPLRD